LIVLLLLLLESLASSRTDVGKEDAGVGDRHQDTGDGNPVEGLATAR